MGEETKVTEETKVERTPAEGAEKEVLDPAGEDKTKIEETHTHEVSVSDKN